MLAQLRLTLWSTTVCTCRRDLQKFPSPLWEFLLTCPIDSHLSIRIDIWFYQGYVRASHTCKLPIAPMGKWLTCLPRLTLAQLRTLLSTTVGTCHRDLENFPSPRWDFHMFCACACRAAVSLSTAARLPSHRAPSLATQLLECVLTLKISHRPDGKMADMPKSTLIFRVGLIFGSIRDMYVPATPANFPSPPWENG